MRSRRTLFAVLAIILPWFAGGCASFNQGTGLTYRTLLICRDISHPQRQTAQRRADEYLTAVAKNQKPKPTDAEYVSL